jgi:imidazolonepropionase-like amidohydrolase
MRELYASCHARVGAAHEAGVPIYAGTDAGSMIAHGRIADEVDALKTVGLSPTAALGAACWDARAWLGRSALEHGAPADLVCYADDPRTGADVIKRPDLIILRGRVFG